MSNVKNQPDLIHLILSYTRIVKKMGEQGSPLMALKIIESHFINAVKTQVIKGTGNATLMAYK
jgi:hypothetical protein